jgi:ribA/ribD-fused uncharacterized protein
MSDLMFNETPINGKAYAAGRWEEYSVHDDKNVRGFFGPYRFLSNFEDAPTYFEGLLYPSSENAYQAAKITPSQRGVFLGCTAGESKKIWKRPILAKLYTPDRWEVVKYNIMAVILADKFYRNPKLLMQLKETGDRYLEETNHWKDQFWGVDYELGGQNNLGKLLMKLRDYLL